jgi:anti-sigma factor RsiW
MDEPESVDARLREHVEACPQCRSRRDEFAENAAFAQRLFAERPPLAGVAPSFEAAMRSRPTRRSRPAWLSGAIGLAAAACVAMALAFTPLGGLSGQLLTIFEPQQFAPIEITASDSEQLRLVPGLEHFGTFGGASKAPAERRITSLAGVAHTLGFEPRAFDYVAPGAKPAQSTFVQMPFTITFTFDAAKARAYEARFARTLPPMPSALDGTTFAATYGPSLVRTYGTSPKHARDVRGGGFGEGMVVFVETKAPRVTSTGATLETAAAYLLSMPNVPPSIAAQLRAIGDPTHTLPIPLLVDKTTASPVDVDGVSGLALGDETGLGSAVVWQKNGVVYAVAGSLKESEALALANRVK